MATSEGRSTRPADLLASRHKGEGVSMPPSNGQRLVSANTTRSTDVEPQSKEKSWWPPGGGVPKTTEWVGTRETGQGCRQMVRKNWEGHSGHSCRMNEVVREGVPRGDQRPQTRHPSGSIWN